MRGAPAASGAIRPQSVMVVSPIHHGDVTQLIIIQRKVGRALNHGMHIGLEQPMRSAGVGVRLQIAGQLLRQ